MERYSSRTIDDARKITIPSELRRILSLQPGDEVTLQHIDTLLVLQKSGNSADYNGCKISDLGTIELPDEAMQKLGWKVTDRISMYHIDNIIIFRAA